VHICGYLIYCAYQGRKPTRAFYIPFVFVAIVWAVSIHTVTAFLYQGLGGRPFWNSAIIAPRFLASAFAAGPAFLIIALRVIGTQTSYKVPRGAIETLRKIVTVALAINMFLLVCEVFTEFYTDAAHGASAHYLFMGLHGYSGLVPWIWTAIGLNVFALSVLFIGPLARSAGWQNLACLCLIVGIWIEKGMGLIVPAFIPTPLGEIVEYVPTAAETLVCLGIWSAGLLIFTIFVRVTIPVLSGRLTVDKRYNFVSPPSSQEDGTNPIGGSYGH
jgi:molybdopterin-containing oxidoreductase family membrane subunit